MTSDRAGPVAIYTPHYACIYAFQVYPPVSVTPTVVWLAVPLVEKRIPFQLEYI